MKKNSKILLTGHTGLVGSNLLKKMQDDGYTNLFFYPHSGIDLLNIDDVERMFKSSKPEYVFHAAAVVGGIQANINNSYKFLYENLMIQNNVINACIEYHVKKVLFLSSVCMYPKDYKQPLKEEYILQGPPEDTNESYALAKICGAKLCEYANKQFDTEFIVLAPSNLYGPGDNFDLENSHVLSALINKIYHAKQHNDKEVIIWGSGSPRREFLFVDDLVDGIIWSMNNLDKTDSFLNIGQGRDIAIWELAEVISKIIGYKGTFIYDDSKPDGMRVKCSDVTKINKLGWKAKTSLKDGIKKTINYYKDLIK